MKSIKNRIEKLRRKLESDELKELENNNIFTILIKFMGNCIIIVGLAIILYNFIFYIRMDSSTSDSIFQELLLSIKQNSDFTPELIAKFYKRLEEFIMKEAYGPKILLKGTKYHISYMTNEEVTIIFQDRAETHGELMGYHRLKYKEILTKLQELQNSDYTENQKEIIKKFINKFEYELEKMHGDAYIVKYKRYFKDWKLLFGYSLKFTIVVFNYWWY